jgi:FkbM family methyltransferase
MIEKFIDFLRSEKINFEDKYNIFDVGSRDCIQSIEFLKYFPSSNIYSFECNPNTLNICENNIQKYPQIKLINKAINEYDGECKFYPIDQNKTITSWKDGNPGASSLFISNGTYPNEYYVQNEIIVKCNRLDTIMKENDIKVCDLLWMDLQGAELIALKSLGEKIKNIKYIYTEVSFKPIYTNQVLFNEINEFLTSKGFLLCNKLDYNSWQDDAIYKNIKL